ncbi:MAG TPA: cytochrome B [Chromatiales bacterium]|nr:cytochrome B [Chromatiales bacterium]
MAIRTVLVFDRFERLWHWSQAASIFILIITGFGLHGFYQIASFKYMVLIHSLTALALVLLWILATFWLVTTGSWRHYVPTTKGLMKVARYYAVGIFKGEEHPYHKHFWRKHNPLQALAYLGLKIFLFPAIWISGLAYLSYGFWSDGQATNKILEVLAMIHVAAAFGIVMFIIAHLYLLTTGHSFVEHVKPMITGFDEIDLSEAEEAYLLEDERGRIKR